MMANGKSKTARRREVRRSVPRPGPKWQRFLRRKEAAWAAGFIVVFATFASFIAITARHQPLYHLGQVVQSPIVTRTAFTFTDQAATATKRREAESRAPRVYTPNTAYFDSLGKHFQNLIGLAEHPSVKQVDGKSQDQLNLTSDAMRQLREMVKDGKPTEKWQSLEKRFIAGLLQLAVISDKQYQIEDRRGDYFKLHYRDPRTGNIQTPIRTRVSWILVTDIKKLHDEIQRLVTPFPHALQEVVTVMAMQHMQPTYLYNDKLTDEQRQQRADAVTPVQESFDPAQVLVPAGHQLDLSDLQQIQAEQQAFEASQSTATILLKRVGTVGLVLLIFLGMWVYIFAFNERVVRNPMRGFALMLLMVTAQALAVLLTQVHPQWLYAMATVPTLMTAMILAITYNQRFAMTLGAIHALLVMVSLNLTIGFCLTLLTGVVVAVAQLREVRTRSKLVSVGFWTGLAMAGAALVSELTAGHLYLPGELSRILIQDCIAAFAAGFFTGLMAQGILPYIESVFKVTTAMTLKDLNDASRPLLQRLAQEASGTYQHSLRIADMAESAAEAIGADGLLCRVGAMYHDIGKINKPMYFIENQGGGPNRHSKLSPAMSLLIIVGHVKDGIEMAREYGLPPVLRHFIESHHGTTLVEYFYHAAKKQKEAEAMPGPSEFEFRYPGPKPQTKEAAIMLLCDGIEGAARALPEPTPVRLDQVVHAMANKRLMDGQFDECNLTLQELARIEAAITKTLCAIYHGRIKYPGAEEAAGKPAADDLQSQSAPAKSVG